MNQKIFQRQWRFETNVIERLPAQNGCVLILIVSTAIDRMPESVRFFFGHEYDYVWQHYVCACLQNS